MHENIRRELASHINTKFYGLAWKRAMTDQQSSNSTSTDVKLTCHHMAPGQFIPSTAFLYQPCSCTTPCTTTARHYAVDLTRQPAITCSCRASCSSSCWRTGSRSAPCFQGGGHIGVEGPQVDNGCLLAMCRGSNGQQSACHSSSTLCVSIACLHSSQAASDNACWFIRLRHCRSWLVCDIGF